MNAALQLRRVLDLLPRIADGEPHRLDALLAGTGVDMRTFLRDIQLITERYDQPGGFVDGVQIHTDGVIVEVMTSHFRRPMRVTAPELCALELGLAMLRAERPAEEGPAIDRARERLYETIARMPDSDMHQLTDGLAVVGDERFAECRAVLRRAMGRGRKVKLAYRKASDRDAGTRTVCPYSLVHAAGSWYLVAHCESGEGVRIFRLDRVEAVEELDQRYRVPPSFDVDALLHDERLFAADRPRSLVVRYSAQVARWIAERQGREPDADGTLTVEHPLADTDWAVRHVLQYGADAEVLAPADVRDAMVERLRAMLGSA